MVDLPASHGNFHGGYNQLGSQLTTRRVRTCGGKGLHSHRSWGNQRVQWRTAKWPKLWKHDIQSWNSKKYNMASTSNVYINLSKYESERTRLLIPSKPPEFWGKTRWSCRQSACSKQLDHSFLQGSTGPPLAGYITNHIKSKHQDPYNSVSKLTLQVIDLMLSGGLMSSWFGNLWIWKNVSLLTRDHSALFREDKSVAPSKPPQM